MFNKHKNKINFKDDFLNTYFHLLFLLLIGCDVTKDRLDEGDVVLLDSVAVELSDSMPRYVVYDHEMESLLNYDESALYCREGANLCDETGRSIDRAGVATINIEDNDTALFDSSFSPTDLHHVQDEGVVLSPDENKPFERSETSIKAIRLDVTRFDESGYKDKVDELLHSTVLNAVVLDAKGDEGQVWFDSTVEKAKEMDAVDVVYTAETLQAYKDDGIYLIARVVVFNDKIIAQYVPESVYRYIDTGEVVSFDEGAMLDPANAEVRSYNLDVAIDACRLGFDEIQYDYIRYPVSSPTNIEFMDGLGEKGRVSSIVDTLAEAKQELNAEGCSLSADIFAFSLIEHSDLGVGHYLERVYQHVDAVSPMIYPSLYSEGNLSYAIPYDHPYEIVFDTLQLGLNRGLDKENITAWLQGYDYDSHAISSQIKAAEDSGVSWMLWQIDGEYSADFFDLSQ